MKKFKLLLEIFPTLIFFWMLFTLDFSLQGIILGAFISLLITLFSINVIYDHSDFTIRIPNFFTLMQYSFRLIYEIYRASFIQILRIIKQDNHSVIVEVQLDVTDPLLITIIANSITLTPGTITVDTDDNILFVLSIKDDGEDGEQLKQNIKNRFEKYFIKKG
ncbi:Na+/H+ antiporter subunit E [Oceanirhabdus seepicola]|uniref:Na+/H+ antiporter subunit E n=1 Tax=Oceanirhabdus seepicola TaxID=2828781 RepID=A0A9J6P557_9CLOT|nr:Na+/H+ antiporter subunit E [Oceanirhabdus seepicola]MCM1991286.1 Na+/H+ antiporter subunit E [Oceanirhabdus seepicola]